MNKQIEDIKIVSCKGDAFRRDVLNEVGLFDESYFFGGEDCDMSFRIKKAGYRIVRNDNCKVLHEFTETDREKNLADHLFKGYKTTQNAIRVGLKYGSWYKLDSLLFMLLLFFGWAVGQFYIALSIGLGWLLIKNFLKSLRYYFRYEKTDIIFSIWLFCIAFDILAGVGWLWGIANSCGGFEFKPRHTLNWDY